MKKEAQRINAQRQVSQTSALAQLREGGGEREPKDSEVHAATVKQALQEAKRKEQLAAALAAAQTPEFGKVSVNSTSQIMSAW